MHMTPSNKKSVVNVACQLLFPATWDQVHVIHGSAWNVFKDNLQIKRKRVPMKLFNGDEELPQITIKAKGQ